jgi:phosphate starvation-inducible protein PhoH and related proteins
MTRQPEASTNLQMQFDDNSLLPLLYGEQDHHLHQIERELGIALVSRGNRLAISGVAGHAAVARDALAALYKRLKEGREVDAAAVDAALRHANARHGEGWDATDDIRTRKRRISPRSANQAAYVRALRAHDLVFGLGPAGTGKTYLAVANAVDQLMSGAVERIVLSRPAVEAGERLGFLPGDVKEKVDPYLRPLYDALHDMLPGDQVMKRIASGEIEIAPLAFMRGRTLAQAYVILDEAQNTTPVQMKMFLTRLGENARMVVTGDLSQIDLPPGARCGLADALEAVGRTEGVALVEFDERDVVRHPLVARIVRAYDEHERKAGTRRAASRAGLADERRSRS